MASQFQAEENSATGVLQAETDKNEITDTTSPPRQKSALKKNPEPEVRRPNKLFTVCIFILVVEMCERLCYYTLSGAMRNYLEDAGPQDNSVDPPKRGLSAPNAISLSACFSMLSYLSCILGGYLADNRLGRYRTILYFASMYAVGVAVVALSALPSIMNTDIAIPLFLFGALVLVAVGTGAIKPNVMNFGADQYDANDPDEARQQKSFFSYFYLTINVGCLGAFGFNVNLATSDVTKESPGSGYFKAFMIAAGAMTIAILAFVIGTPKYTAKGGVVRTPMISVMRSHLAEAARQTTKGKIAALGWWLMPISMVVVLVGSILGSVSEEVSNEMTYVAMGLTVTCVFILVVVHVFNNWIPELPNRDALMTGAISLEEVKGALACMPTILCINIGFNIAYNAMNNAYPAQACQMDTRLFGTQLNGAFFTLGDAIAIIVLVPFFEGVLFPLIVKLRNGAPISRWAKYTAGFTLAMLANGVAVLIEYIRRGMSEGDDAQFVPCPSDLVGSDKCSMFSGQELLLSKCSPEGKLPMTNISAFWTFIPMFLTGAGEILVNPVVYQYVFEHAPVRLRSLVQGMQFIAAGAISNAVTASLSPLIPQDFNKGQLVYYFYANIGFAIAMLIGYWCLDAFGPAAQPAVTPPNALAALEPSV